MILSCNNVQEVSLKLLTLPEHVANSTRQVAKADKAFTDGEQR